MTATTHRPRKTRTHRCPFCLRRLRGLDGLLAHMDGCRAAPPREPNTGRRRDYRRAA